MIRGERVQDHGQRGGERLALAGPHLGDGAVVQDHAADQLDVEMALPEGALARLAREREGLVEEAFERLAVQVPLAQRLVALAELVIRLELELGLEGVDQLYVALEVLELLRLADAESAVQNCHIEATVARLRGASTPLSPRL